MPWNCVSTSHCLALDVSAVLFWQHASGVQMSCHNMLGSLVKGRCGRTTETLFHAFGWNHRYGWNNVQRWSKFVSFLILWIANLSATRKSYLYHTTASRHISLPCSAICRHMLCKVCSNFNVPDILAALSVMKGLDTGLELHEKVKGVMTKFNENGISTDWASAVVRKKNGLTALITKAIENNRIWKLVLKFYLRFICCSLFSSAATLSWIKLAWNNSSSSCIACCRWLCPIWVLIWKSMSLGTCSFVSVGFWYYLNGNSHIKTSWDFGKFYGLTYLVQIFIFFCA